MSNLREEFEKLRLVEEMLRNRHDIIFFSSVDLMYVSKNIATQYIADWLNAAWYAFQEQQKKLGVVLEHINKKCDEFCETHDMDKVDLLEEIEELLK